MRLSMSWMKLPAQLKLTSIVMLLVQQQDHPYVHSVLLVLLVLHLVPNLHLIYVSYLNPTSYYLDCISDSQSKPMGRCRS